MNTAAIKYTKIVTCSESGDFGGSSHTVQEDITAMLASTKRKQTHDVKPIRSDNKRIGTINDKKRLPSIRHFKASSANDATLTKSAIPRLGMVKPIISVIVQPTATKFAGTLTQLNPVGHARSG